MKKRGRVSASSLITLETSFNVLVDCNNVQNRIESFDASKYLDASSYLTPILRIEHRFFRSIPCHSRKKFLIKRAKKSGRVYFVINYVPFDGFVSNCWRYCGRPCCCVCVLGR